MIKLQTIPMQVATHMNVISAAMADTYDESTFIDGNSANGYAAFYWTIFNKNRAEIFVKYDIESGSVTISTIDVKRKSGKGYHHYRPSKSKKIRRLVVLCLQWDIPMQYEACFRDE